MFIAIALLAAGAVDQPSATLVKKDPMVCKHDTATTGSNIRSTICMKKSEWDLVQKNSENKLSDMHGRTNIAPQPADRGATPN